MIKVTRTIEINGQSITTSIAAELPPNRAADAFAAELIAAMRATTKPVTKSAETPTYPMPKPNSVFVLTYNGSCPFKVGDIVPSGTTDSRGASVYSVRQMWVHYIASAQDRDTNTVFTVGVAEE